MSDEDYHRVGRHKARCECMPIERNIVREGGSVDVPHITHRQSGTCQNETGVLMSMVDGTSVHRYIGTSVHRYIGTSVHRYIGTSVHRYIGTSVHRYIRTSVHRYIRTQYVHSPALYFTFSVNRYIYNGFLVVIQGRRWYLIPW